MKGPILLKTATFQEKDSSLGKKKIYKWYVYTIIQEDLQKILYTKKIVISGKGINKRPVFLIKCI